MGVVDSNLYNALIVKGAIYGSLGLNPHRLTTLKIKKE